MLICSCLVCCALIHFDKLLSDTEINFPAIVGPCIRRGTNKVQVLAKKRKTSQNKSFCNAFRKT